MIDDGVLACHLLNLMCMGADLSRPPPIYRLFSLAGKRPGLADKSAVGAVNRPLRSFCLQTIHSCTLAAGLCLLLINSNVMIREQFPGYYFGKRSRLPEIGGSRCQEPCPLQGTGLRTVPRSSGGCCKFMPDQSQSLCIAWIQSV